MNPNSQLIVTKLHIKHTKHTTSYGCCNTTLSSQDKLMTVLPSCCVLVLPSTKL